MKIALIQPPGWTVYTPPLGIAYLSAYLKDNGYKVTCYDFNIEAYQQKKHQWIWNTPRIESIPETVDIISYFKREIKSWTNKLLNDDSSIIGFSISRFSKQICLEITRRIKQQDKRRIVIFGGSLCVRGPHLTSLFQEGVDIIVLGEGEKTLYEIVKTLDKKNKITFCPGTIFKSEGKIIDCGDQSLIENLDTIPYPDFSDFQRKKYLKPNDIPILANRGCIGSCAFCSDHLFWKKHRSRSAKNVFEEMMLRFHDGYMNFHFCDLAINCNLKLLDKLCNLIIHNKLYKYISFGGYLRSRFEMDLKFFKKLKKAGFEGTNIGVESGSQKILNLMNKGYKINVIEKNLKDMHRAGIRVSINLLTGFPGETLKTINETIEFLSRNREFIDEIASITGVGLKLGSLIAMNLKKYRIIRNCKLLSNNIIEAELEGNWQTLYGKNTAIWREEQAHRIYMAACFLGIRIGFSEIDRYYIPFIENYWRNQDFKKMYKISMEVMKHNKEVENTLKKVLGKKEVIEDRSKKIKKIYEKELRNVKRQLRELEEEQNKLKT